MPSTSKKQSSFMKAVANNPKFAKKVGVPQSVGADFSAADKGKKFGGGGLRAGINNPKTRHGKSTMFAKGGSVNREATVADVKNVASQLVSRLPAMAPQMAPPMARMNKGGDMKNNYSAMEKEHVAQMKKHGVPKKFIKQEEKEATGMNKGGKTSCYAKGGGVESKGKTSVKMVKMASGGSVSGRADGIASKGKTNCKIC